MTENNLSEMIGKGYHLKIDFREVFMIAIVILLIFRSKAYKWIGKRSLLGLFVPAVAYQPFQATSNKVRVATGYLPMIE